MAQQKRLDELFPFRAEEPILSPLRRLTRSVESRLTPLEAKQAAFDAAITAMQAVALSRINTFLAPAIEKVQELSTLGFLTAESDSSVALVQGESKTFTVNAGNKRDLFTPSTFVDIGRRSDFGTRAIGLVQGYDRVTGALDVQLVEVTGGPGPFEDWSITASAGLGATMRGMYEAANVARNEAQDARADAQSIVAAFGDPDAFIAEIQAIADQAAAFDPAQFVEVASMASRLAPYALLSTLQNDYATKAFLTSTLTSYATTNAVNAKADASALTALTTRVTNLENAGYASAAQIRSKTTGVKVDAGKLFDAGDWVQLTDAGTIGVNFNNFLNGYVTLGDSRTLGTPTNVKPGQTGTLEFIQGTGGGKNLFFESGYAFIGAAPVLSTAEGARDAFAYLCLRDGKTLLVPQNGIVLS